jgi:hypothetical protein
VPIALTLLLLVAWAALEPAGAWTLFVIAILVVPAALALAAEIARKPPEMALAQHFFASARAAGGHAAHIVSALVFLAYEAVVNLDAIARTAWRMIVTRRRLLDWTTSAAEGATSARSMVIAPVIALGCAIGLALTAPAALAPRAHPGVVAVSPAIAACGRAPAAPRAAARAPVFLLRTPRAPHLAFFDSSVTA